MTAVSGRSDAEPVAATLLASWPVPEILMTVRAYRVGCSGHTDLFWYELAQNPRYRVRFAVPITTCLLLGYSTSSR